MIGISGIVVGITNCMASRGKIVDRGAMETGTRMYLKYLIVMLDVEVCIYFALLVVLRGMNGSSEHDSIYCRLQFFNDLRGKILKRTLRCPD